MVNQSNTGYFTGETGNPPHRDIRCRVRRRARRRATSSSTTQCRGAGAAALAPSFTDPNFLPARMQTWNVNVEREFGGTGVMVGYFGSHGDRLRIPINLNQFTTPGGTVRPYPRLSATSPILPGRDARQHHRGDEPRLVGLQGTLDHGEPPAVARAAAAGLVHAVEVDRHQLVRRDRRKQQRLAAGQHQPRRQRGPVGLRRPPPLLAQRAATSCRSRQPAGRTAGRWSSSSSCRRETRSTSSRTSRRLPASRRCGPISSARCRRSRRRRINDSNGFPVSYQWFDGQTTVCDPRIAAGAAGACTSSSVFALPV